MSGVCSEDTSGVCSEEVGSALSWLCSEGMDCSLSWLCSEGMGSWLVVAGVEGVTMEVDAGSVGLEVDVGVMARLPQDASKHAADKSKTEENLVFFISRTP